MAIFIFMQIQYARLTPTPTFKEEFDYASHELLIEHGDAILTAYDNLECELRSQEKANYIEHNEKIEAFRTKSCAFCGGRLNFIDINGGFWGCENYNKISGSHSTFSGRYPIVKPKVDLPRDILGYILKECGLSKKIKYKQLYEFIMGTGRDDLRINYGYTSTENLFNGYAKAKERSLKQERECLEYLQKIWEIVIPQQCIQYKLVNEKEKICIPDFICSNKREVKIVDAKLDMVEDEQIDLYVLLVEHMLKVKNDNRLVSGAYIVYDAEFGQLGKTPKYPLIRI